MTCVPRVFFLGTTQLCLNQENHWSFLPHRVCGNPSQDLPLTGPSSQPCPAVVGGMTRLPLIPLPNCWAEATDSLALAVPQAPFCLGDRQVLVVCCRWPFCSSHCGILLVLLAYSLLELWRCPSLVPWCELLQCGALAEVSRRMT